MTRRPSTAHIQKAVRTLRVGGVVLFPSESSYGLATPYNSRAGIRRILQLKQRTDAKFTVIASSLNQAQHFFSAARSKRFTVVAQRVWPGPVSLVVSRRLSVRVPQLAWLRTLAAQVGRPLIATSANQAGQPAAYSLRTAARQLDLLAVDAIIDGGRLPRRSPSGVVQVTTRSIRVLRPGPASTQQLLNTLTHE